ncbi:YXWGXW repeat-containing protein [Bradyrhizobium sp. NFR13]|jgi:hypothetical protein|uniref:YXWGXW repeat-containing protein n=1 Tax=Bradyrhizobium sp. NFR13 TaxID=1566285 RepID=UPI0008E8EA69|nr:YXWGXW repeat-containing protein [Bradyrhizobium sp. NFR13]SFL41078.1 YXWGXW repeat-containing protein [Bradyrhizobium sp. NFR13]
MRRFRSVTWLLAALGVMTMPVVAMAQIISITIAPPDLPIYEQPAIPAPGYIWTPGFWAYGPDGYYWVPGTWVEPPQVGLLWTPGYWSWHGGYYGWNAGYWGTQVGFYGGVDYGYGYNGIGYGGGRWTNGVFAYNRTVNNFGGVAVTNVYNQTIVNNTTNITRVSFNGGTGGTTAQPTPQEQAAARQPHIAATAVQTQHEHIASANRALLASENHGHPAIAATAKPGEFTGKGVVAAREIGPTAARPATTPAPAALPAIGAKPPANRPVANATPENKGPATAVAHATTNGAVPPKPLNTAAKPPVIRQLVAQHPAAPRMAAVAKPPAPPHVAAARPAPHPVAARPAPRAAPHPPARPKAPPHNDPHRKPE